MGPGKGEGAMQVYLAQPGGLCAGMRAIEIVARGLNAYGGPETYGLPVRHDVRDVCCHEIEALSGAVEVQGRKSREERAGKKEKGREN